jgi:quercetin dioxygenase-like cupin family protein
MNDCPTIPPDREKIRAQLAAMEAALTDEVRSGRIAEAELPLRHVFTDGVYGREMTLPAGTCVVGKIHRHAHLNFLLKGRVSVLTEEGGLEELRAPRMLVSPAGVKRAVYVHEEAVWTVVHVNPTNTQDLDEIERFTIAPSYAALEAPVETARVEGGE